MTGRTCDGPHPYPEPGHPHPEGRRCYCSRCERAGHRWAWGLAAACQEVGQSGLCRLGHPVSLLADTVAGRLYAAGIEPHDPALTAMRAWNASVTSRRATEVPAAPCGNMSATFASPQEATRPQKNSAPVRERTESASTSQDLVANGRETSLQGPHTNRSLTAPAFSNRSRR